MMEHSDPTASVDGKLVEDAAARLAETNSRALNFMSNSQRMMLEETVFASKEMFNRAQTEMHLFSEFISKMAEAHSVKNLKAMWEECGRHQIGFVSRDCERLFTHGERLVKATSKLFSQPPQN
jgi:hypothetical protein